MQMVRNIACVDPARGDSHTVPPHPEQLDEQDADEQDDRLPPASPDSSAGDSLPREDSGRRLTLCAYTILLRVQEDARQTAPPQIGQENVALPPKENGGRRRGLGSGVKDARERADPARAVEAEVEAASGEASGGGVSLPQQEGRKSQERMEACLDGLDELKVRHGLHSLL
ncbi:hypothetical protein E4U15_000503 [Claviceps sp. LM218 group G6]|nr:hypothetical protein E4U15_000503 [Claviceps sp. LM218 group G6]